jgi:hypothetical protein
MFNILLPKIVPIYEILWKNISQPARPQMTIWRMRFASCITKVTNTHSEYVILIAFFTATVVAQTRLSVTLYVHCLSGLVLLQLQAVKLVILLLLLLIIIIIGWAI